MSVLRLTTDSRLCVVFYTLMMWFKDFKERKGKGSVEGEKTKTLETKTFQKTKIKTRRHGKKIFKKEIEKIEEEEDDNDDDDDDEEEEEEQREEEEEEEEKEDDDDDDE
ncbi:hypothetical protein ElyMa_000916600 [Elysia marginata]|uniref:Uncharacterized protein n=1 Tax=Elysia marginata TaxID=1093978 RepID=A0AAV4H7W3_9GAST|nr:hypothetical protein ElyMa_000916600 [Elysia marginata]